MLLFPQRSRGLWGRACSAGGELAGDSLRPAPCTRVASLQPTSHPREPSGHLRWEGPSCLSPARARGQARCSTAKPQLVTSTVVEKGFRVCLMGNRGDDFSHVVLQCGFKTEPPFKCLIWIRCVLGITLTNRSFRRSFGQYDQFPASCNIQLI